MSTEQFPVGAPDAGEEKSLFDSVMEDAEPNPGQSAAPEGEEAPEDDANEPDEAKAEAAARERDEKGRFAKLDQRQEGTKQAPQTEDRHAAGIRRELTEERARRQAIEAEREADRQNLTRLQAQMEVLLRQQSQPQQPQAQQPKAEPVPDRWTDPEGYDKWLIGQAESRVQQRLEADAAQRVELSLQDAQGRDPQAFSAAYQAAQTLDPQSKAALTQRLKLVPDAGQFLVNWHKQEQARREIGSDPIAFREKVRTEVLSDPAKLMEDPAFRQAAMELLRRQAGQGGPNGGPRNITSLPPSISDARGSNTTRGGQEQYDNSERGIFESVMRG